MSHNDFQEAIASVISEFNAMHRITRFEQSQKVLMGTTTVPARFETFASL